MARGVANHLEATVYKILQIPVDGAMSNVYMSGINEAAMRTQMGRITQICE